MADPTASTAGLSGMSAKARGTTTVERPVPLREAVYEAIVEMIITRILEPGQHIVEKELATQLGVSRQPVREALQRLQNEGWVDLRPAFGAFVHVPTPEEADQLLAVRTLLETESARLAAKNTTAEHVERLWQLQAAGERALAEDDQDGLVTANADLHAHFVRMSGNAVLAEHIAMVDRRVRWYYASIALSRGSEAWEEHAELINAIASGNGKRSADLMRRHSERTRDTYLRRQRENETRQD